MSVATPKSAAKEPIAIDIILVCRKQPIAGAFDTNPRRERGNAGTNRKRERGTEPRIPIVEALDSARAKFERLLAAGFALSRNDRKIILYGQLLTTLAAARDAAAFAAIVDAELYRADCPATLRRPRPQQQVLFEPT